MIFELITNLALMLSFTYLFERYFSHPVRSRLPVVADKTIIGALHGLFGTLVMFFSVTLTGETIIDFRSVIIVGAAYFGGLYSALWTSLLIGIGRVLLLGGINGSSAMAALCAVMTAIGASLIMDKCRGYWMKWTASALLLGLIASMGLSLLIDVRQFSILPSYIFLLLFGGLFKAYLIHVFERTRRLSEELVRSESRYKEQHQFGMALLRSATGLSIMATDAEGKIRLFSKGAELMLGYAAEEVVGKETPFRFHSRDEIRIEEEARSLLAGRSISGIDLYAELAADVDSDEREWTFVRRDGSSLCVSLRISPIKGGNGLVTGYLSVAADITERKAVELQKEEAIALLRELSARDGLTELANRRVFDEMLEMEWSRAIKMGTDLSLIMLDIDYFKRYNDRYGHLAGDACLKEVAGAIRRSLQGRNQVPARYGGEEFAIILPETDARLACEWAERIRSNVGELGIEHAASTANQFVSVSIGVASTARHDFKTPQELIESADQALYRAKSEGRDRVRLGEDITRTVVDRGLSNGACPDCKG